MITLWLCGYVLWIDLTEEISTKFQDDYDLWFSDEYLDIPYEPTYSKDPFGDAMKIYKWMSTQTRVAWVKYVEKALSLNNCSLSKKKQWAILYYYVPEFRSEIARNMKMEMGDYGSENYVFDEEVIFNYCTEFYNCVVKKDGWENVDTSDTITSGTPEDIKTNCKEFFLSNYREWEAEEKRVQNLQISWLWNDKYLNGTVEDSPFDDVNDLGTLWELWYLQAQKPVTPVFYDLAVFAKSKSALMNGKNWGNSEEELTYGWSVSLTEPKNNPGVGWLNTSVAQTSTSSNPSVKPLSRAKKLTLEWYDTLVEWLWAFRLNNDDSVYYWSLCRDAEEEAEWPEVEQVERTFEVRDVTVWRDIEDLTKAEYEELAEYMFEAVNSYVLLSDEKKEEIDQKAWKIDKYFGAVSASQTEAAAKQILNCYQTSCVGLSIDDQIACMLRCSCGESTSDIFDPEANPGMWPIYVIRYCAVPTINPRYFYEWSDGTDSFNSTLWWSTSKWGSSWKSGRSGWGGNWWGAWGAWTAWWVSWWNWWSNWWSKSSNKAIKQSFNVGWKTIVSKEEWIDEILWVVEKLAREWRLWTWTQQPNFFDSSTKLTDVADTFSFTINQRNKDVSQKVWEPTDEYLQRTMETKNENWLVANHVANPLDNPATRNYYSLVGSWGSVWDISSSVNADLSRQAQWYLNVAPSFVVDQSENSSVSRYVKIGELYGDWFDEQWDFWAEKVEYLDELDSYAKSLYAKKW